MKRIIAARSKNTVIILLLLSLLFSITGCNKEDLDMAERLGTGCA
jgi:hypothetical protein